MIVRRETPADVAAVRAVHSVAFPAPRPGELPVEVGLLDALRASDAWVPALSLVACPSSGDGVVGHVVATKATVAGRTALGLGPIGVVPDWQRQGVGSALMHAVLAAADALEYPLVVLLGNPRFYRRFGFRPAAELGVRPPDPSWREAFQARPLAAYTDDLRGEFCYAAPFNDL
ncbi:N-acetyltransferase [Thermocrispum sp.]|uniref:N-acetyltransferase n=1 Tax=Thermocrispum agreste TaxID=37925 RepID=A0A2W4JQV9_9PSEU|nr:N-acetyltransferase [Thermocrispum sp.]PZN00729.1 MAG: GNAT family N-acetyltransferase [Thermocrispum agreste]